MRTDLAPMILHLLHQSNEPLTGPQLRTLLGQAGDTPPMFLVYAALEKLVAQGDVTCTSHRRIRKFTAAIQQKAQN